MISAAMLRLLRELPPQRHPQLRARIGIREIRRHDSDHRVILAVEPYVGSDNVGIGREAPPPQSIAKDRYQRPLKRVLLGGEYAPALRLHAQRLEQVRAGDARVQNLGQLSIGRRKGEARLTGRRDALESGRLVDPVAIVLRRDDVEQSLTDYIAFVQTHQAVGGAIG